MKRQISLKWRLTIGIVLIWVVISGALYGVFNNSMNNFTKIQEDTMKQFAASNASIVGNDIAFEVAASMSDEVRNKLLQAQKKMDAYLIFAVKPDGSLIAQPNDGTEYKKVIKGFGDLKKTTHEIIGDLLVATHAITSDGSKVDGYLFFVKSLKEYYQLRSDTQRSIIISVLFGLVLLVLASFFLGHSAAQPIHLLVTASQRIADGDLENLQTKTIGSAETAALGLSINKMAKAMQRQVFAIKKLTSEMSEISRDVEGTMTNLASAASEQAAAVNETAATVEEMEKAGQSASVNANQILNAAEKATEASTRGRESVEKTYEIIMKIKEDSQNISDKSRNLLNSVEEVGNIIQSVNGIAEQSKILAVNASIEAAKAGEYGSGFAVVAQEVKDLAQQSKDATLQITGTLTAIRKAIEAMVSFAQRGKDRTGEGVNTIANAGAIMNDLSEAIRENSEFANVIAANINQQTVGLTQIATAIEEINSTAMENQNISRNIVEGTRQMNDSFHLLTNMVDRWRTPDTLEIEEETSDESSDMT